MRHRKGFNHLGRTDTHRKAMLANMAASLIVHKRITTTTAKAKALRSYVEPLLTKSKDDSTHSRRVVFSYLQDKKAVAELFREVSPKIADRPGGYTRILKTGNRLGDNAEMCVIELVDFNENMLDATTGAKSRSTRRGRRGKKKTETTPVVQAESKVVDQPETSPEEDAENGVLASEEEKSVEEGKADESAEQLEASAPEDTKEEETAAVEPADEKQVEETPPPAAEDAKPDENVQAKAGEEEKKDEKEPPADIEENKKEE